VGEEERSHRPRRPRPALERQEEGRSLAESLERAGEKALAADRPRQGWIVEQWPRLRPDPTVSLMLGETFVESLKRFLTFQRISATLASIEAKKVELKAA